MKNYFSPIISLPLYLQTIKGNIINKMLIPAIVLVLPPESKKSITNYTVETLIHTKNGVVVPNTKKLKTLEEFKKHMLSGHKTPDDGWFIDIVLASIYLSKDEVSQLAEMLINNLAYNYINEINGLERCAVVFRVMYYKYVYSKLSEEQIARLNEEAKLVASELEKLANSFNSQEIKMFNEYINQLSF
jgi:hypothetical protein